jgi:hypothetical protein
VDLDLDVFFGGRGAKKKGLVQCRVTVLRAA